MMVIFYTKQELLEFIITDRGKKKLLDLLEGGYFKLANTKGTSKNKKIEIKNAVLFDVLRRNNYNYSDTAVVLGTTRSTIWKMVRRAERIGMLPIDFPERRKRKVQLKVVSNDQ